LVVEPLVSRHASDGGVLGEILGRFVGGRLSSRHSMDLQRGFRAFERDYSWGFPRVSGLERISTIYNRALAIRSGGKKARQLRTS
jgi:hypothetical protein